jgi:uncharacterized membrane protein YkgB
MISQSNAHGTFVDRLDSRVAGWMVRNGTPLLRISLGIVFLWFGALKFFPGVSPAQDLAIRTMDLLTMGMVPAKTTIIILATWECLIGIGLLANLWMRLTLFLLFVQMLGTFTPIVLFTAETFSHFPFVPSMEGQYIIKNLVLISAGIVIGSTLRTRARTHSYKESYK